jgi:hypothetical protein
MINTYKILLIYYITIINNCIIFHGHLILIYNLRSRLPWVRNVHPSILCKKYYSILCTSHCTIIINSMLLPYCVLLLSLLFLGESCWTLLLTVFQSLKLIQLARLALYNDKVSTFQQLIRHLHLTFLHLLTNCGCCCCTHSCAISFDRVYTLLCSF